MTYTDKQQAHIQPLSKTGGCFMGNREDESNRRFHFQNIMGLCTYLEVKKAWIYAILQAQEWGG